MPKLNLSTKLSLFLLLICLSTSLTVGWISYINSKAILEAQTFDRLTAMQTAKTAEIERYFEQVANQIHTAAGNPNTINALVAFNSGFARLNKTLPNSTVEVNNDALEKFYRDEFLPQLVPSNPRVNANNALESAELESSLASLIPRQTAGLYLQEHYIVRNPNVSGEKHLLTRSSTDSSDYADAHETYHPVFRSFLEKFNYYDIFLVDSQTGNIVYSVFKETDFGTSLTTGPYRNTNIAKAFALANQAAGPGPVHFVDFEPYLPSFDAPAAFISAPVFRGDEQLGALIFQVPVDRINDVMTGGGEWSEHGLGDSGETYLVGPDFTMRSASRFYIEDPQGYSKVLKEIGYPEEKLADLQRYGTSILNQTINTHAAMQALGGQDGTRVIKDYREIDVLSSFGPIDFGEDRWAVIAEIDASEAFAPIAVLQRTITFSSISVAIFVVLLGLWAVRRVTRPVVALTEAARIVGEGGTVDPVEQESSDEIGQLTGQFNQMMASLHEQKITIDRQTSENDQLLLNVLPEPIAIRLKNGEAKIADAFPSVSVLFADIVGFTEMSRAVPPITILRMLDDLFGAFDQAALELGVEKIKTIGDCYMAVCGLPYANAEHADQVAALSLKILEQLQIFNRQNGTHLKMRVGAHSGAVVAGVVGSSKFIYDLWGDTVNMASRMESTSVPDHIQVSAAFRDHLSKPFNLDFRGELNVKGVGAVSTYFLSDMPKAAA
jgi:class 3 adenylate cyclase